MKNKTIAIWITISVAVTWLGAFTEMSDSLIGLAAMVMTVFACIGAYRLNKIID